MYTAMSGNDGKRPVCVEVFLWRSIVVAEDFTSKAWHLLAIVEAFLDKRDKLGKYQIHHQITVPLYYRVILLETNLHFAISAPTVGTSPLAQDIILSQSSPLLSSDECCSSLVFQYRETVKRWH